MVTRNIPSSQLDYFIDLAPPSPEERLKAMLAKARLREKSCYTPKEVSRLFEIGKSTVHRYVRYGKLKAVFLPGLGSGSAHHIRIDWASLVYFIGKEQDEDE